MSGAVKATGTPPGLGTDDLTLVVNGKSFGGWQEVSVTRGIEIMPSHFDITLTERYPKDGGGLVIAPGQSAIVKIGKDTVITGTVDRYVSSISPNNHRVRIMGRGKCRDLVDCSAGIDQGGNSFQVNYLTAFAIATQLSAPFGIQVLENGVENDLPVQTFQVNFGESPWDIIDRIAQWRGLIAREDQQGNLVLETAGLGRMASGLATGIDGNVQSASVSFSCDQRFSDYFVPWQSVDTWHQEQSDSGAPSGVIRARVRDPSPANEEFRPRAIVSEQTTSGTDFAETRGRWEMNRRNGRSQIVSITCDNWRDGDGTLWEPNSIVTVSIPACKLNQQPMLITEVTFRRGDDGTTADLVLMPQGAFGVQPFALSTVNAQVAADLAKTRGGASATPLGPAGSISTVPTR